MTLSIRKSVTVFGLLVMLLPVLVRAAIPLPSEIPNSVPEQQRTVFKQQRAELFQRRGALKVTVNVHNSTCRGVKANTPLDAECQQKQIALQSEVSRYAAAVRKFNLAIKQVTTAIQQRQHDRTQSAELEKAIVDFFTMTAAAIEKEKSAANKELSIISAPLTPGSASPSLLSGRELDVKGYETRKSDVFRRLIEQTKLRDECREKSAACSTDGKAYDEREAIRRRDRQYFLWGEASYYIRFNEFLKDPPPEMAHEIGALGGIKAWPYGWLLGDKFYFFVKEITNYGSTQPGGEGYAKQGLQKAINDNRELNP